MRRAMVGVGLTALVLVASCESGDAGPTIAPPPSGVVTTSLETSTTFVQVPDPGDATCAGDGFPASLLVGPAADLISGTGDHVWVSDWQNATLTQVDLRTLCVVRSITVGDPRSSVIDMATTEDTLWVADFSQGALLRIDATTGEVLSTIPGVPVGNGGIVEADGALYLACCGLGQGSEADPIMRVDLEDETVSTVATLRRASGIAVGFGSLWVGSYEPSVLTRIDLDTGEVIDDIPMPGNVADVATSSDAVWVAENDTPSLVKIDPESMEITQVIDLRGGSGADLDVAVDGNGDLWVAGRAVWPSKIDGRTGETLFRLSKGSHLTIVGDRVYLTTPAGWLVVVEVDG